MNETKYLAGARSALVSCSSAITILCLTCGDFATGSPLSDKTGFPRSSPQNGQEFDFGEWRESIRDFDFNTYRNNYPGPYSGWFRRNDDRCAEKYIITWGPLGIRTRMHDHTWGDFPAFRRAWPEVMLDAEGDLLYNCFEVVDVIAGSPADGHLREGDLLVAMDGGLFKTALAIRPNEPLWKHQHARGLEIDAGERLDIAEGRGRISFDVIRPEGQVESPSPEFNVVREIYVSEKLPKAPDDREILIDVPILEGQEISLLLELTGDRGNNCSAEIIAPKFVGTDGSLDLSEARSISERSGWRQVSREGITYNDQEIDNAIWIHAPGHLTWMVPAGYERFQARIVSHRSAAGFKVKLQSRSSPAGIPPTIAGLHQVVDFNIPKIGSYAPGFPDHDDAKSRMVADMVATWLVDQQKEDGSWIRPAGYTHNGFDTAWVGLGLLAHGDPAHLPNIQRAAEFIAFKSHQDDWSVPRSVMVLFLAEYWLRTEDDNILVPLQSQVEQLRNEMVHGDWTSGHKRHPGYRGGGLAIGGSHAALALAVASRTPVQVEPGLVDNMLLRAQELAPGGAFPYGRGTRTREFTPNLEVGGEYSGRHGPYLIASLVHGGPRIFTENSRAVYELGPVGGIDRGHATDTLTTSWALIASAAADPAVLARHMAAMRWKFTMLRRWDGGFGWNATRLEYMGGEGLFPPFLRSGAYLVAYNGAKRNLAITGAPQWQAEKLRDAPPVCHDDAVSLGYYQRNWGVVASVLGDRAPLTLRNGLNRMLNLGKTPDTHQELYGFLHENAPSIAKEILKMNGLNDLQRHYLAEMILGIDIRLDVEVDRSKQGENSARWNLQMTAQHPMAGWQQRLDDAESSAWRSEMPMPMEGEVSITNHSGVPFGNAFTIQQDFGNNSWHIRQERSTVDDGPPNGPLSLVAHIRYRAGELVFDYQRPIIGDGEEAGSGEKGRKLLGDRIVWVRGKLEQDLIGWNASFSLPSGQYIAAAAQGVGAKVHRGDKSWISPHDGTLPKGTVAAYGFNSGWQLVEARIAAIRLPDRYHEVMPDEIRAASESIPSEPVMDYDLSTGVPFKGGTIEIDLREPVAVRALDLRLKRTNRHMRQTIEAWIGGDWKPVFVGRSDSRSSSLFPAITTNRLKVLLHDGDDLMQENELLELRIYPAMD